MSETKVVVVGGGPVGLTLAMDLAWRGIDVTLVETRAAGEPPNVKCNTVSSRSMEVYRRLGLAEKIREAGLPPDHSTDVVSATSVTGLELSRLRIPSRNGRKTRVPAEDSWWPTPEPSHRINQLFFEPILFRHAAEQPRINILNRHQFEAFSQDDRGVVARIRDLESGKTKSVSCQYLVGCDGGRSAVRKQMGSKFAGTPHIQPVQSSFIRAPKLKALLGPDPAWMYFVLNPRRCGTVISIDGKECWNVHNFLYNNEEYDQIDRAWAIRQILGVGPDFEYEIISKEDWMGRRMVADRLRNERIFIAGDAAHLWIPAAGYGMNAGIADAADLAWMLAGVLDGWANPSILDAYQAERRPITEQISHIITDVAVTVMKQRRQVPENIEDATPAGEASRRRLGEESRDLEVKQQCSAGLNFGYFYVESPVIAYDGENLPAYSMHEFTSSTIPGCRAPHLWLEGRRSLYDLLGPGYTLIRTDPAASVERLLVAAAQRGVPVEVLDIDMPAARNLYAKKLTLVRPDQYVAWRGDCEPDEPLELIDLLRGAGKAKQSVEPAREPLSAHSGK